MTELCDSANYGLSMAFDPFKNAFYGPFRFGGATGYTGDFARQNPGRYTGGNVPEGMVVYEFPGSDRAVFNCIGPIPDALQSVNTRIFREWLPGKTGSVEEKYNDQADRTV